MKITAIIQARIDSSRLPKKALLPLGNQSIIEHIIDRVKSIEPLDTVVLATSTDPVDAPLCELAEKKGILCFRGSKSDVLARFYRAMEVAGGDFCIRVTGDNPCVDPLYASRAVRYAIEEKPDLSSLINMPLGTAVEVIKTDALLQAYHESDVPYQREHVTPYIKEHPELFSIQRFPVTLPDPWNDLRLTVDTHEDYELMRELFHRLGPRFSLEEALELFRKEPHLMDINSAIEQRPMTHCAAG